MTFRVTLIPGDGIGPEIAEAARRVLDATGVSFDWDVQEAGAALIESAGTPLPESVVASVRENRVAMKGPIGTPVGTGFASVNVSLRKAADLYGSIRPCKSYPGAPTRFGEVDVVIVRDTTEDLYAGIEFAHDSPEVGRLRETVEELQPKARIAADAGITIKAISDTASRRVVRLAFDFARANGRQKVTAVHKGNVMKATDGLFIAVAREVAAEYDDVEFDDRMIDALCAQLVRDPQEFDVLVSPMQYGDILSDLCAGLAGGVGIVPGVNVGTHAVLFEPTHGSAPKYAGQNKANPMAMMLCGVMLLRHIGEVAAAERLERAIAAVIAAGDAVTYDLKADRDDPTAVGTSAVADAVIEELAALPA